MEPAITPGEAALELPATDASAGGVAGDCEVGGGLGGRDELGGEGGAAVGVGG